MANNPYANSAALTNWLPDGAAIPSDALRMLARASDLLDDTVTAQFTVDANGIPTDPEVAGALSDACCAVVEYWLSAGEDLDVSGRPKQYSIGKLSVVNGDGTDAELPPRAMRALRNAKLVPGMAW